MLEAVVLPVCVVVVGEHFYPLRAKNSLDFQSRTAGQAKRFGPHDCLKGILSSTHSTKTHTLLINDPSCLWVQRSCRDKLIQKQPQTWKTASRTVQLLCSSLWRITPVFSSVFCTCLEAQSLILCLNLQPDILNNVSRKNTEVVEDDGK